MIYITDKYLSDNSINPITGKSFDDTWIVYYLTESKDYQILCGDNRDLVYSIKVSKEYPQWMMSVCDFIQYQNFKNKNIILYIMQDDLDKAKKHYIGHNYNDTILRKYEPDVLIHSTAYENWIHIQQDNCLKSWNILKKEKTVWEDKPIGTQLGDPKDFCDYIMFSSGEVSSEIVVLSKQQGKIVMNQDMPYKTSVRMYFDSKKIAEDGLLIRDGVHLKVEDKLPLSPYLLWVATWENAGLSSNISTPKEFTEKSNSMFNHIFAKYKINNN